MPPGGRSRESSSKRAGSSRSPSYNRAVPRVFVSYAQESAEHDQRVEELVRQLQGTGFDVAFDHDQPPGGPPDGWAAWSERAIRAADKVIVVCSEKYCKSYDGTQPAGRGRGSAWEAGVMRAEVYSNAGVVARFRAAVFDEAAVAFVPWFLQGPQIFRVAEPPGWKEMVAWLSNAPGSALEHRVAADEAAAPPPADVAAEPISEEIRAQIASLRQPGDIRQLADALFSARMGPEAIRCYTLLEQAAARQPDFRLYVYANERIATIYWRAGDRGRARQRWSVATSVYEANFPDEVPALAARISETQRA
jgi:TIR domain